MQGFLIQVKIQFITAGLTICIEFVTHRVYFLVTGLTTVTFSFSIYLFLITGLHVLWIPNFTHWFSCTL